FHVLVVQVESVFPHVQHEQWSGCYWDTVLLVVELFDDQVATDWFISEDGPTGTLDAQCCCGEVGAEVVEGTEEFVDCGSKFTGWFVATFWGEVVPEDGVVGVATKVECQVLGQLVDVAEIAGFT